MEIKKEKAIWFYREMLRIRMVEATIAENYNKQPRQMHTPIHLYDGQEAVAVGVCSQLRREDVIFSNHRCHGHYLAKGGDLKKMIAELYSKNTGCCHGMGGSMHLTDKTNGIAVSSAIVAGNVSIATGYALAMKMSRKKSVAVVFMGDGASEEGTVYESISFARIHKLPVLYICENNLYAISSNLEQREPLESISDKFKTICNTEIVDGNDVISVSERAQNALKDIKEGSAPYFLECKTYRLRDHHNIETGIKDGYRTQEEWDYWAENSPIEKIRRKISKNEWLKEDDFENIEHSIRGEIVQAFQQAYSDSLPDTHKYLDYLWG